MAEGKTFTHKPKAPIVMSTPENLEVLFEDNHIIAVNKRSSDIVQGDITNDRTLDNVIREYLRSKYSKPGEAWLGTIHRIDRPVSGVILYAKTSKALSRMMKAFKHREVAKTYWAVVKGTNQERNKSYAHDKPGDGRKESELNYYVLGKGDHYNFVEVHPKTGRHHQIRVTLAALDCPIKGDIKYGSRRTNDNASIHLHARRIEFVHPTRREVIRIVAPPPEDNLWDKMLELDEKVQQSGSDPRPGQ
jgi:23S rRNA pseudouridine1911/1915/1917 synthase